VLGVIRVIGVGVVLAGGGVFDGLVELAAELPARTALRHVLVGCVHSVADFAAEVAAAEGGDPLPAHEATKIIGELLAELD
jgi:hypothetical protein